MVSVWTKTIRVVLTSILLMFCGSCGGGTTGTDSGGGDRTVRIVGVILSPEGAPISGAEVTVVESGEVALSDDAGAFEIAAMPETSLINLQVVKGPVVDTIPVGEIPVGNSLVSLDLTLNDVDGMVSVTTITITVLDEGQNGREGLSTDTSSGDGDESSPPGSQDDSESSNQTDESEKRSIFLGSAIYSDGAPASKIRIVVEDTGNWDLTSKKGRFSIETPIIGGDVTLAVEFAGLRDRVTLPNIPWAQVKVEVELQLSIESPPSANPRLDERVGTNAQGNAPKLKTRLVGLRIKRR